MGRCVRCTETTPTNLCDECAAELGGPLPFVPEQVLSAWVRPLGAALVDVWGRAHRLEARTEIGRTPMARGISILHGSVSRQHAEIVFEDGQWSVRDRKSRNETRVNDVAIDAATTLAAGDTVAFGDVVFCFALDDGSLDDADVSEVAARTLRRGELGAAVRSPPAVEPEEPTYAGLPSIDFRLVEAPSGGGGYFRIADYEIRLSDTQYALVEMMTKRMLAEEGVPALVRGFVPTGQLIADLPWDTSLPTENHVKQLVRRVRRALDLAHLGSLIESRRGFGYRLKAVPRVGSSR